MRGVALDEEGEVERIIGEGEVKEEGDDTGLGGRGLDERSMKISYSLVWDLKIISEVVATQPPFLAFMLSKSIKPTLPKYSDISASPFARAARGGSERAQIFQARALRGKTGG